VSWDALSAEVAREFWQPCHWDAMALHRTGYHRSQRTRAENLHSVKRDRVLMLAARGWSVVRIAHETGEHRRTVAAVIKAGKR
jgi:hypothetical protein